MFCARPEASVPIAYRPIAIPSLEPADSVGEQPDKERATPPGQIALWLVAHDGSATRRLLWLLFLPAG
jgi:hypothetical protein